MFWLEFALFAVLLTALAVGGSLDPGPQTLMTPDQLREAALQRRPIQRPVQFQRHDFVVCASQRLQLFQKPQPLLSQ